MTHPARSPLPCHAIPLCSAAFAAGAIAGAIDTSITMPLDTVKTTMQLKTRSYANPIACARAIVAADGYIGLYHGFQPFLFQASGKAAVRFFMYENIVQASMRAGSIARPPPHAGRRFAASAPACARRCSGPRLRSASGSSAKRGPRHQGAGARASTPWCASRASAGCTWARCRRRRGRLRRPPSASPSREDQLATCASFGFDPKNAPWWLTFLAGGTAGSVSAVLNNPIDVVKSRIQSKTHGNVGIVEVIRGTLEEGGIRAFGAGLQARCLRLFASQAIQFSIVDQLTRRLLRPPAAAAPPPPSAGTPVVGFATALPQRHPWVLGPPTCKPSKP